MSKQKLVMKYHPAKKEVEFHRFQNGTEVPIRNDSRLRYYMNMKGKFILQDFGNTFFDDIAKAFDGLKSVDIDVITTRLDYEDFVQMTEYYNEGSNCKMNPALLAELPDMNKTFLMVQKYGEEVVSLLHAYRQKMFDVPLENENVKKSAQLFAGQIDEEIKNIEEKIYSLTDNNVSLCFSGVYSSGKSALINAILGYRILPENIKSETAKMFQISSPQNNEDVKIIFEIASVYTELDWNEKTKCFEFVKAPSENPVREEIQKKINTIKEEGLRQHEQIKGLLDLLNTCPLISDFIQVKYPIPIDSKNVQFTIYDTPGTDSNHGAHQKVLTDALKAQRQSILIFVVKPDGLEGEGNDSLLNYLEKAEGESKTSIDIDRSLFVINKADMVTKACRETLQHQVIRKKNDDNFSIKLADKKLFFTSALYAYLAKAVENGLANEDEKAYFTAGVQLVSNEAVPTSFCYRQNRCATSELSTEKMIKRCDEEFQKSKNEENITRGIEISSGLYALKNEIVTYGEKYASSVKAFAIIDSIDKVFTTLNGRADSLREINENEIDVIQKNIDELRKTITFAIEEVYNKITLPPNKALPEEIRKKLRIDKTTLEDPVIGLGHVKMRLDKEIKGWFFGHGKVRYNENYKEKINSIIEKTVSDFTDQFFTQRKMLLEERRDVFMDAVKKAIDENGNISESAKKVFQDIPEPKISKPKASTDWGDIYNSHKRIENTLWFKKWFIQENLDKESFMREIDESLTSMASKMVDDYGNDYRNALETLLMQIKTIFESNLELYSINMKGMIEDKESMKKLGDKISETASALGTYQHSFDELIWKVVDYD